MGESIFKLRSDEWVFVKPAIGLFGDTIHIDAKTDVDNVVVSWGDHVKNHKKL